jgi:hypothetical protein
LLIMLLGGFLVFCSAIAWVVGSATWHAADPHDPRKILAIEVATAVKARALQTLRAARNGASRNGHGRGPTGDDGISHG